jgi:integrase
VACVRKRRGVFVLDYRDAAGKRRWESFARERDAKEALARLELEGPEESAADRDITLSDYATRWLAALKDFVKPRTLESYEGTLRVHLLPQLGDLVLRRISRGRIKQLIAEKLNSGLSRNTVRLIHATLHGLLAEAVEDGIIRANPAARRSRSRRSRMMSLSVSSSERQENIKAMTREQLSKFLASVLNKERRHYPPPLVRNGPLLLAESGPDEFQES